MKNFNEWVAERHPDFVLEAKLPSDKPVKMDTKAPADGGQKVPAGKGKESGFNKDLSWGKPKIEKW